MLVQARLFDLHGRLDDRADLGASIEAARQSEDWRWRFFGALYDRAVNDELGPLLECGGDAPRPELAACAAAAAASALSESCRADEAVTLLDGAIARDEAAPVDHAWLRIQRARARAEIGSVEAAREDALVAQGARLAVPNDASASAISAAAAILLFNTTRWGQRDVADVISGADTASSWWRAQATSRGLGDVVEQAFKSWARDPSVTLGGENTAHNDLVSAGLTSSHAGDHGGWRHHSSLDAKQALIRLPRNTGVDDARDLLDQLRVAGDDKALAHAARHLLRNGPARAITLVGDALALDSATKTTGLADLTLIKFGGDVVDRETADRLALWLLNTYRLPSAFEKRTTPSYLFEVIGIEALAGVLPAAGRDTHSAVVDELVELGPLDELEAIAWVGVAHAICDDAWGPTSASSAADRARAHDDALRWPLLGLAAGSNSSVRKEIFEGVRAGSLDALSAFGDVRQLPADVARARIESLAGATERIVADARRGRHGFGTRDVPSTLVLLNAWHAPQAIWDPLIELLECGHVSLSSKRSVLSACAHHLERVPHGVREALIVPATLLADGTISGFQDPFHPADASGDATFLLAALGEFGPREVSDHFARLLTGSHDDRQVAARLARHVPRAVGALTALTGDVDPGVRATAAAGLVYAASEDEASQCAPVLRRCAEDPGVLVPTYLAAALSPDTVSPIAEALRASLTEQLSSHCSAQVRELARQSDASSA